MDKTEDIRAAVEDELRFDPLVDAARITVKNIGGEVALNGTVPSYPQYLEAAAAARRLTGVTRVHNHLEVVLPPGDECDDATLTTEANNILGLTVTVPNTVRAAARDGNLTLAGFVHNGAQRAAAEQAVAGLPGVRNVRDQIEVVSGDPLSDVTVLVQDALARYAVLLDNSKVTVSTSGHTVTLAGHVRTWAEHDAAVAAAWMAHGISDVHDQIQVTG
jgi:osmotically-inducible protein OsmY